MAQPGTTLTVQTSSSALAYTPNQQLAIGTVDENLQIIACAGSGKTQVVSERVVEILRKKKVEPRNIVAFTFTERAGAELKDRITKLVREQLGEIHGLAEMYVGTIHGYCLNLLQTNVPEYFKFQVLTEVQARLLIDRASVKAGLKHAGLKRWVESRLFQDVASTLREANVDLKALLKDDGGKLAWEALDIYQRYLDEKRYFDYTEIMVQAVALLSADDDLRAQTAERVKYLIVDEYQDVNPLQESLVNTIHSLGANLCVVGDDDQTIYQWRGSNVEGILEFDKRYSGVTQIAIEENYRSSGAVVDAARLVIENNDPDRLTKKMVSAGTQSVERGDLLCLEFKSPTGEAEWIAKKAKSLIGVPFVDEPGAEPRGLAPSDIAILLRSVKNTGDPIVAALRKEGLPVIVVGMTGLFDTPEAMAAVALFEFMVKRIEKEELRRAWLGADLGIDIKRLNAAIASLEQEREWDPNERFATYNLQRTFLRFLENLNMREEEVPGGRGELIFYNLGKFSQVISDFEQIHFQSDPQRKYESFANFLHYQAPGYYPEGWQEANYVRPDAVQVMTVHQAKGMEWPIVFIPALQRNRFPSKKQGGKNKWHVIPKEAIRDADRYDGSVEDERRLFYVALTRSKKYLFCSWAPHADKKLYKKHSIFVDEFTASANVLTKEPKQEPVKKLDPKPHREVQNVALSFSELKYYFECPYQFKLRFLYGFNPPLQEALGYGKSLHDALAEVHKRALEGDILDESAAEELLDRHLNTPFAYKDLRENLRKEGIKAVQRYLKSQREMLPKTTHVEQVVEINLGDGLVVNGRIDLIRNTETNEIIVIDFKSTERAQEEDVSRTQLHIYALGYKELTGESADLIEIYNLDEKGQHKRELVDPELEEETRRDIVGAGESLRANSLPRLENWGEACGKCDLVGICRQREHTAS